MYLGTNVFSEFSFLTLTSCQSGLVLTCWRYSAPLLSFVLLLPYFFFSCQSVLVPCNTHTFIVEMTFIPQAKQKNYTPSKPSYHFHKRNNNQSFATHPTSHHLWMVSISWRKSVCCAGPLKYISPFVPLCRLLVFSWICCCHRFLNHFSPNTSCCRSSIRHTQTSQRRSIQLRIYALSISLMYLGKRRETSR